MRKTKGIGVIAFLLVFAEYVTVIKYFVRAMSGGVLICSFLYILRHLASFFKSRFFWLPVAYYSITLFQHFFDSHLIYSHSKFCYIMFADFMRYICPVGIFLVLMYKGDYKVFRHFIFCTCVYMFIMSVITIKTEVGTARIVGVDTGHVDLHTMVDTVMTGCWGYNVIHQLPFVMFGAMVCAKEIPGMKWKFLTAFFGVTVFLAIYRSGFGVAILLSLLLMAFLFINGIKNNIILSVAICILAVVLWGSWQCGIIGDILEWISAFFEEENVITIKINEIIEANRGNVTGDAEARSILYGLSWEGFLQHPILGGGWDVVHGGHSLLLDVLARDGLLGFSLLLLCYLSTLLKMKEFMPKYLQSSFLFAIVISLIMMSLKNLRLSNHIISLMFLMPSFFALKKENFMEVSAKVRWYFKVPPHDIIL